jgi:hypothetical protein
MNDASAGLTPADLCKSLGKLSHDTGETAMMNKDTTSERGIYFICALNGDWFNLEVCLFKKGFEHIQTCKAAEFFKTYRLPTLEEDGTFDVPIENTPRKTSIQGKIVGGCLENNEVAYLDGTMETGAVQTKTVFVTKTECVKEPVVQEDIPHTSDEATIVKHEVDPDEVDHASDEEAKCCCKDGEGLESCKLLRGSELAISRNPWKHQVSLTNPLSGIARVCPKSEGFHSWDNKKHFSFNELPASCK